MNEKNTTGIISGSLFILFSLLTNGACCMGGVCNAAVNDKNPSIPENIKYEELGIQ